MMRHKLISSLSLLLIFATYSTAFAEVDYPAVKAKFRSISSDSNTTKSELAILEASLSAKVKSPHFTTKAHTREIAQKISKHAELEINRISKKLYKFSSVPNYKIIIRVWTDEEDYQKAVPNAPETSKACTWEYLDRLGVSCYRIDIVLPENEKDIQTETLDRVIPHEITHILVGEFFKINADSGKKNVPQELCPLALLEGMSIIAEKMPQDQRMIIIGMLQSSNPNMLSLKQLLTLDKYSQSIDPAIFYAQAYSFVEFLRSRLTEMQFTELMKNMREGESFEVALQRALFLNSSSKFMAQLEKAWKDHLITQYKIVQSLAQNKTDQAQAKK